MVRGAAIITIRRAPSDVYAALTDISRMGEWSPECTGGRWVAPADGPEVGATFEGDNRAKLGPITVKKWTTTSTVTACVQDEVFAFSTGDYTTWRYEFIEIDGATRVTQSFQHEPFEGFQKLLYVKLMNRKQSMITGMEATLERLKNVLEDYDAVSR